MGNHCCCFSKDRSRVFINRREISERSDAHTKIVPLNKPNIYQEVCFHTEESSMHILKLNSKQTSSFELNKQESKTQDFINNAEQEGIRLGIQSRSSLKKLDISSKSKFDSRRQSLEERCSPTKVILFKNNEISINRPSFIFLGESGSGKTSFIYKICYNKFDPYHIPTIKPEIILYEARHEGTSCKVNFVDTCGLSEYKSGIDEIARNDVFFVYVVDLTNSLSLNYLKKQLLDQADCLNKAASNLGQVILGNKIDLATQSKVEKKIIREYANEIKIPYFEVSAKTSFNLVKFLSHCLNIFYSRKPYIA